MSTTAQINDSLAAGHRAAGRDWQYRPAAQAARGASGLCRAQGADIPSVLVETAFISNPEEEARLRSSAYQQQLADALMRGITRYFARTRRWRAAGSGDLSPVHDPFGHREQDLAGAKNCQVKTPDGKRSPPRPALAAWWRRLSAAAALCSTSAAFCWSPGLAG